MIQYLVNNGRIDDDNKDIGYSNVVFANLKYQLNDNSMMGSPTKPKRFGVIGLNYIRYIFCYCNNIK
jgi:hypothetical protein